MKLIKRGMILLVWIIFFIFFSSRAIAQSLPPEPTNFFSDPSGDGYVSQADTAFMNNLLNNIPVNCLYGYFPGGIVGGCLILDFANPGIIGVPDMNALSLLLGMNNYLGPKVGNISVVSNTSNIIFLHVNRSDYPEKGLAGIAVIPDTGESNNVTYNAAYNITNNNGDVSFVYTINQYNQQQVLNFTTLNSTIKVLNEENGMITVMAEFAPFNTTFNFSMLPPVNMSIYNVTLEPNITIMKYWQNETFNCSMSFTARESLYINISWYWFEGVNVLISNTSFNADYRMSNHTNVINGTYWAPTNLTNGSDAKNYKYGYNYTCMACIYNGSASEGKTMICANSSNVSINGNIKITMLPYLGNPRAFSVGVDDFLYGINGNDTWGNYKEHNDGLKNIIEVYDKTNQTKISLAMIPRPDLNSSWINASNLTTSQDNFRWISADLEYDKYIAVYLHGERHNTTGCIEYVDKSPSCTSLSYASNLTKTAFNMYQDVIGRNATTFKFPDYSLGSYGSDVIKGNDTLSNFPYKVELSSILPLNDIQKDANNTIVIGESSLIADPASSFGGNYFVSAQNCPNSSMVDCINNASYKTELVTTINYAEAQSNISYLDFGELGEAYSMYSYTNLELINDTMFQLITTSNWTYKKRLALNITGIFINTLLYANITTPSGLRIAQNMTKYTGTTAADRAALVILPVENGNYSIIPIDVQSPDPYFIVENVTIYANNTKWSFNGTNDSDSSAYIIFKLNWTGPANVWGDYNNTDNNFNFTHGFKFNHTKGDNWWVEHDMKTGKLHILGNSSTGAEYITAQMPFTFARTINNDGNKKYVINTTNMFKNITGSFNLSIPETYDASWSLTIRYANGTNVTPTFYRSSSIVFSIPGIQEDSGITIEYTAPAGPGGGCSGCGGDEETTEEVIGEEAIPELEIPEDMEPDPIEDNDKIVNPDNIIVDFITESGIETKLKLILDDVGLLKKKPRLAIEFKMPEIQGTPRLFKLFKINNLVTLFALVFFILFIYSNYKYVKSGEVK